MQKYIYEAYELKHSLIGKKEKKKETFVGDKYKNTYLWEPKDLGLPLPDNVGLQEPEHLQD